MKIKFFHHPFISIRLGFVSAGLGLLALASPLLLAQLQTAQPLIGPDPAVGGPAGAAPSTSARANEAYGKLSLSFEANQGQTDPSVNFLARGAGYTLFLTPTETVFVRARNTDAQVTGGGSNSLAGQGTTQAAPNAIPSAPPAVLRMKIVGANAGAEVAGVDKLPGIVNYLIGNEPEKWHTNIPTFGRVQYRDVYPGIDLVYYGNQRQLEYDFVVAPGRDAHAIALEFQGADKVEVDAATGDLLLEVGGETLRQQKPVVYQEVDGARQEVESGYVLKGDGRVGFAVGAYDASRALIIDPVLAYSTYLGGSDSDIGGSIAVDSAGNAYVTGTTTSADFPTTAGAFQTTFGGGLLDVFVTKLNAAGSAVTYSTYLGGNNNERGRGIVVDPSGNAYVTGSTLSANFPTKAGAPQPTFGGGVCGANPCADAFVAKLNAAGSALIYSTYLGGSGNENSPFISGIAVDSAGNAYVVGNTDSTNFPTVNALQATLGGSRDAFVTKLNAAGSAFIYSSYLGGSGADDGFEITVDSSGNAYVTGETQSANFPTANAFQTTLGGPRDAFVSKLNPAGSAFVYSTYLGGSDLENGLDIAVDSSGNAYVTGETHSANYPTTAGAFQTTFGGGVCGATPCSDAFVTKLNAAGSALIYSTYLGASDFDFSSGIAVDSAGNAYVTGSTASTNFPTTATALQPFFGGTFDVFVTKLNTAGSALIYSTYLGGNDSDGGLEIVIDPAGNAYVTGSTFSNNFPTTTNAFQTTGNGGQEAFIAKLREYSISGRVIDSGGVGISGVTVTLSGTSSAITTTDSGGNFVFRDITPNGNYTVTPFKAGFTFTPESITINSLNANQDLLFVGMAPQPTPTPTSTPTPASQAINLSTRMFVQTGDNIGIGGFIITGTAPKHVLVRAIGPSLTRFGITNPLADPVLQVRGPGAFGTIDNDNWRDTQEAQIKADGIPPTNDLESAIDATLPPGRYTALVSGKNNTVGVALVEVYDLDTAAASKLANLSTRAFVGTGSNIVIAGFFLGNNAGQNSVVVRGLGPSLAASGVPNPLADPTLELRDADGTLILSDNDWQDDPAQAAQLTAAGLAPANAKEAAIAATLSPGLYTVLLSGINNTTGIGLVEVYARGGP